MSTNVVLDVGSELEPIVSAPLRVTDFVIYQGAANDQNPIHHDTEFAIAAGYPSPFAVGMAQAGVLANLVADVFGPANMRRLKVQFRELAWPGDVITYTAVVVARDQRNGESVLDLEMAATRQTGGVHVLGWATVAVT